MRVTVSFIAVGIALFTTTVIATPSSSNEFGPSTFVAKGEFPTSVYQHYYNSPTATSAQVQPIISDPVSVRRILPSDGTLLIISSESIKYTHCH